jgi:hypothetical protein
VNDPLAWPKSSLSRRFSGMAPQLTATNCPARRCPVSWIVLAASSLPVPLSPRMKTGASESRTFSIIVRTLWTDGADPRNGLR